MKLPVPKRRFARLQSDALFERAVAHACAFVLLLLCLLALTYQWKLLQYLEWGDESETIVAARMMAAGMPLYSTIFNHHGPLTFLTGFLLEQWGPVSVSGHRMVIALLQWVAIGSMYFSPLFRIKPANRIFVGIALAVIVALLSVRLSFGHTYTYQVLAGLMLIVILAQYTLPAIMGKEALGNGRIALGNVLIISLPFLAVTYLPIAGLLFLCSMRRYAIKKTVLYAFVGVCANAVFLGYVGSFEGFFAYHLYLNSQILPGYNEGHGMRQFVANMLSLMSLSGTMESFIAFSGMFLGISFIVAKENSGFPWRSILLLGAMFSLLLRGLPIHGVTFWYAYIGLLTLAIAQVDLDWRQRLVWLGVMLMCAVRLAVPLTLDPAYFSLDQRVEETTFGKLARAITSPNDRVLAYSFRNYEYIAADRLPASGHFFFLPWQQKYNQDPKFGIYSDPCKDLERGQPKLVMLDRWKVWGKFSWESYGQCIQQFVDQHYTKIDNEPIYVRNDLHVQAVQFLQQESRTADSVTAGARGPRAAP